MKKMKVRVAEVSYEDRIDEYNVIAEDNLKARDLIVKYLAASGEFKSIRVRDTVDEAVGPARVVGKIVEQS